MIEQAVGYIMQCISMAGENQLMGVSAAAEKRYNEQIQAALGETVWAKGGCNSWYMREDGRIATLYPYNARRWKRQMRRVDATGFVFYER